MKYVGIQKQIRHNNRMSFLLLLMFPIIILGTIWCFLALLNYFGNGYYNEYGEVVYILDVDTVNYYFLTTVPWVVIIVGVWFAIAYFSNVSIIQHATGACPLARRENPRVYNIVENLCMAGGMPMPKINIIATQQLNAFASGINQKSYTVTLTTGIINQLNDDELSGVIAHELTHIRNRDTRLLVVSIIFVGIISTIMSLVVRMMYHTLWFGGNSRRNHNEKSNGLSFLVILFVGVICCAIAYFFTLLTRFAISRKREYMADAGGAELCGNPLALANALRKISANPGLNHVQEDVAQLFIIHPEQMVSGVMGFINSLFATHPDTQKRIAILEQF